MSVRRILMAVAILFVLSVATLGGMAAQSTATQVQPPASTLPRPGTTPNPTLPPLRNPVDVNGNPVLPNINPIDRNTTPVFPMPRPVEPTTNSIIPGLNPVMPGRNPITVMPVNPSSINPAPLNPNGNLRTTPTLVFPPMTDPIRPPQSPTSPISPLPPLAPSTVPANR